MVLSGPEVMLSSSASVAASHSPRPREDEVVQSCPGQPGVGALPGDQAAQFREIGPAEHDVKQVTAAVGDVIRPEPVKRDDASLSGHFRHVGNPPRYVS